MEQITITSKRKTRKKNSSKTYVSSKTIKKLRFFQYINLMKKLKKYDSTALFRTIATELQKTDHAHVRNNIRIHQADEQIQLNEK